MKVAVLIPTYFGSATLGVALDSLRAQTYTNFKVYFSDDTPPSAEDEQKKIEEIVKTFGNEFETVFHLNNENIGYPKNLISLVDRSTEEFIFLLAQDDVLSSIAIESCVMALMESPQAKAVSRPYFWFDKSLNSPIRQIPNLRSQFPELVTTKSDWWKIERTLIAASQLTGLMYRRSGLRERFVDSIFPAHIYPLAGALRDGGVVYLPYPTVAVSVENSQTRTLSSIYKESPAKAWINLYERVFSDNEFRAIRNNGIRKHMGKNFVGLIQIRSFGKYLFFLRELKIMIWARPTNLIDPRFVVSAFGLAIFPRRLVIFIVSNFKSKIIGKTLESVHLASESDAWWL